MNPRIIFQRAGPTYEKMLAKEPSLKTLNDKIFVEKIDELQKLWNSWGDKIITELNEVTKLEWMDVDIRCYITAEIATSFSHPLTLKMYDSIDDTFDVFIHELIHRLLNNQNHPRKFKEAKRKLLKEYENESEITKYHILLHAIHAHVLMKFFDENRLKRVREFAKDSNYRRSWEIVADLGFENILQRIF